MQRVAELIPLLLFRNTLVGWLIWRSGCEVIVARFPTEYRQNFVGDNRATIFTERSSRYRITHGFVLFLPLM